LTVGFRDSKIDASLAVPPGYWVVRDNTGKLALYADSDFRRGWTRQQWPWTAAADRDKQKANPHLEVERNAERSAPRREATSEQLARAGRRIDTAERIDPLSDEGRAVMGQLAKGEGWMGHPPAEGTRRALILETINAHVERTHGVEESAALPTSNLWLADAIESALLQATIDAEAMERGAAALTEGITKVAPQGDVPRGTTELQIVLEDVSDPDSGPEFRFIEIENQLGAGVRFESMRETAPPNYRRIKIPYARDDQWVASQVAAATERLEIIAQERWRRIDELEKELAEMATECKAADDRAAEALIRVDKMRSALAEGTERVGELENQLENVRETLDQIDAPRAATFAQRIGMLYRELTRRRDETVYDRVIRAVDAGPTPDDDGDELTDTEERLYGEREEARAGEGRFAEERDAAFALLRWLLPVTVAKRLDSIEEGE
jgi:hypothetical protein